MRTIVEPKEHINKLWGKQRIRDGTTYRMMRYVLRVDHDGKVLLHNVVTGRLVVLEQDEAEVVDKLPLTYEPMMDQLVAEHYLVPEDYDEHQQVMHIRTILRKYEDARNKAITHYVILPTTACNARCYYCFEQGVEPVTMTEQIAEDVVRFITVHSENHEVSIQWFGGEPTIAAKRIDQICKGLRDNNVKFSSTMISNGYLFDEEMVLRAEVLWKLRHVQITVDGTEGNYNRIKAYVNCKDNPFQRVMRNVELLTAHKIAVGLRMNYDTNNYEDFDNLLAYVSLRFPHNEYLSVYSYPIIGEYKNADGKINHGTDEWFAHKTVELNDKSRSKGLLHRKNELPFLHYKNCAADDDAAITINALGKLVKCAEHFQEDQWVGSVKEGILNRELVQAWKVNARFWKCPDCTFYPRCVKLEKCGASEICRAQDRTKQFVQSVMDRYDTWSINSKKEGAIYGISGTDC